jgi:DNA-binding MurR/RpiR family transcriptional regulator
MTDSAEKAGTPLPPRSLNELREVVENGRRGDGDIRLGKRSLKILEGMLARPEEVTLGSISAIARQHDVSPSTLSRLAQRLGFEGFKSFQQLFRLDIARSRHFYTEQAQRLVDGDAGTSEGSVDGTHPGLAAAEQELRNVAETLAGLDADDLAAVRDRLLRSGRLYVLGLRGCYSVAHYLGYYLGFISRSVVTLGASGFTLAEEMSDIGPDDTLVAITVRPETRLTVDACRFAAESGATVVTMTNHHGSPVRAFGDFNIHAQCEGPHYFNPVASLFVVAEMLLAEIAATLGEDLIDPLKRREAAFEALGTE